MDNSLLDLRPAGLDLFEGFDGLVTDLSEEEESTISGGGRSRSRRRRRRQNRRRRRQNRRNAGRSISNSRT